MCSSRNRRSGVAHSEPYYRSRRVPVRHSSKSSSPDRSRPEIPWRGRNSLRHPWSDKLHIRGCERSRGENDKVIRIIPRIDRLDQRAAIGTRRPVPANFSRNAVVRRLINTRAIISVRRLARSFSSHSPAGDGKKPHYRPDKEMRRDVTVAHSASAAIAHRRDAKIGQRQPDAILIGRMKVRAPGVRFADSRWM